MQVINTEISGKTCTLCNADDTPAKLLRYYAGVSSSQYTGTPSVTLVTNTGIRVEVDSSTVDILYPPKYTWKFSVLNQESNVGFSSTATKQEVDGVEFLKLESPVSSIAHGYIKSMVSEAEKVTGFGTMTPHTEWKNLTKESYSNGFGGETHKRYNTYNGMLSKHSSSTLRPHVKS